MFRNKRVMLPEKRLMIHEKRLKQQVEWSMFLNIKAKHLEIRR
ncbi:hypothetical protein [Virgibacillus ainsalahensis]